MSIPRKHHEVPVAYQRGFCGDDGFLWWHDKNQRNAPTRSRPQNILVMKDLYSKGPNSKRDTTLEAYNQKVEDAALPFLKVLRSIKSANDYSEMLHDLGVSGSDLNNQSDHFVTYLANMITRNTRFMEYITKQLDEIATQTLKSRLGLSQNIRVIVRESWEINQTDGKFENVSELAKMTALGHDYSERLRRFLLKMEWLLIVSDNEMFISSDYPVSIINDGKLISMPADGGDGLYTVHFPICSHSMLIIRPKTSESSDFAYGKACKDFVIQANEYTYRSCREKIIGASREAIEKVISDRV